MQTQYDYIMINMVNDGRIPDQKHHEDIYYNLISLLNQFKIVPKYEFVIY